MTNNRKGETPVLAAPDARPLLRRILDTPHLAHVVPRLAPQALHRVIETYGLEDCAELVALATSAQLAALFDLDLWRAPRPGLDEELDPARFGLWLEVLMESGPSIAAEKLAGMNPDVVIAALAQHVRVQHCAAIATYMTTDGELMTPPRAPTGGTVCEIGGCVVEATRADAWDAIVALLICLDAEHPEFSGRVLDGCVRLSDAGAEVDELVDLLTAPEQDRFDLAVDREGRREKQGFVTPAQARAFLQMARGVALGSDAAPAPNPVTTAYFRSIAWAEPSATPQAPVSQRDATEPPPTDKETTDAIAAVGELLVLAGVTAQPPRALLEAADGEAPRFARIRAMMQTAQHLDYGAYSRRSDEFAYLVNTLLAGGSVQARPFTAAEAADAVLAAANLGVEHWPSHWSAVTDDFLVSHDLVVVFQVGWTVLHGVAMETARRLIGVLAGVRYDDPDIKAGIATLRARLTSGWRAGEPWQARDALDVILMFDMPAWAALSGLLSECPVIHAALGALRAGGTGAVNASAFEFISERGQIASIRAFMASLPDLLRP